MGIHTIEFVEGLTFSVMGVYFAQMSDIPTACAFTIIPGGIVPRLSILGIFAEAVIGPASDNPIMNTSVNKIIDDLFIS